MADVTTLGQRLSEARGDRSQAWLAEQVGVTQTAISYWESGKREPSLSAVRDLARLLDVEAGWLAWGDETPTARLRSLSEWLRGHAAHLLSTPFRLPANLDEANTYSAIADRIDEIAR